jgi:hypothetical protein
LFFFSLPYFSISSFSFLALALRILILTL